MSEIKLFEGNRSLGIPTSDIIDNIKNAVSEGEVPALETGIMLKKIAKISEEIFKDEVFKTIVHNETLKSFEGKNYKGYGMTISERATSTFYDFTVTNDPLWIALDEIQKQVKELIKAREEDLKGLIPKSTNLSMAIANTETKVTIDNLPKLIWENCGEEVTIKPPIKYQKMGLVYSEDKEKKE